MILLAILGLTLAGIAITALLRSLTLSRTQIAAHLNHVNAYGYTAAIPQPTPHDPTPHHNPLTAIADHLGSIITNRIGTARQDKLRKLLTAAGIYTTPPQTIQGYRALATTTLAALGMLTGGSSIALRITMTTLFAIGGWTLPVTYIRRRAQHRALEIERETPNLIDQIVVSLEAGNGFSAALQASATRLGGPLADEMRLTLQEQRMGTSLTQSLQHLRDRIDSTNLQSFVRAVVQGERLGVSIGQVMRDLATDMRKRRRQHAEEQAQKTPVKLLLPLVFLILPTIFIVVLIPPILQLINNGL